MIWLLLLFFIPLAGAVNISFRNEKVYWERLSVIHLIGVFGRRDIMAGRSTADVQWRWDHYEAITYDQMIWRFWKPVDSFFDRDYLSIPSKVEIER